MEKRFFRVFEVSFSLDNWRGPVYCGVAGATDAVHRIVLPRRSCFQIVEALHLPKEATRDDRSFPDAVEQIRDYLRGERRGFAFNAVLSGTTPFQKRVYEATRAIAYGGTLGYGDVAVLAKSPGAGRAVGQALGRNPLPLFVPCHRVVRSDGSLGGFGGGLSLKRRLLDLEAIAQKKL